MRTDLPKEFKVAEGEHPTDGRYAIPHPRIKDYFYNLHFSSDGEWEHLSISIRKVVSRTKRISALVQRTPTWAEMCFLKDAFWRPDQCVIQYVEPSDEFTLHLWRPTTQVIPQPPKITL